MVERFNQTLIEHLAKVVDENQRDLDRQISLFLMAYRSVAHTTTGETLSKILFGTTLRTPAYMKYGVPPETGQLVTEYVDNLGQRLHSIHHYVRLKIRKSMKATKTRYDLKGSSAGFNVNDLVWLYNLQRRKGQSPKLQQNWEGPYQIVT